ncbi:polysaccharide deacetylase family protein [Oerskovia merdavium]|uniref:Polysaccharide deacetylase family protein n=1 Tax=Oerskovia merdavium TaxID=2762227 RepID=A0ABR8TWL5_9CELL|nr:polysaccharide deacetylase family protein [Oerskovia merdavium]MBD7980127.1 polysaccharide deacetylase family protein [Oerskovia merdavium]
MPAPSDLVARLGLPPGSRALILNADDFGMCRAANRAITELLVDGHLDSTTLMVPCPWAPEALAFAASRTDLDLGVHLVLTSEWTSYRWRPLTGVRTTLVDAAGYFPVDCRTVEEQASDADVAAELAAQLDAALAAGMDVTHLDNHMGSVYGVETGRTFLPQVFELAARHGLPFRLPRTIGGMGMPDAYQEVLDQATAAADAAGVVILDHLLTHPFELLGEGTAEEEDYASMKAAFLDLVRATEPGVTEFFLHPMLDDDELGDVADFAVAKRGFERRLLVDPDVAEVLAEEGIVRVGWRDLRDVQRGLPPRVRDAAGAPVAQVGDVVGGAR